MCETQSDNPRQRSDMRGPEKAPDVISVLSKTRNGGTPASVSYPRSTRVLPQPSRRMREQGVDEAGFRGEMAAQHLRAALVARDLVEQPLELGDVAIHRLLEAAVGAIFAGDFVESLLACRGVETLGESLALAALIAVPHLGGEIAIHQPADIERQRCQGIVTALRGPAACGVPVGGAIGAAQQFGKPSVASLVA